MRQLLDPENLELTNVLSQLLASDVDVTVREVARRHSQIKHASAFTRNTDRAELINDAIRRQQDARNVHGAAVVAKAKGLAEKLAEKTAEAKALGHQVRCLVASHAACVRAVMQHGGMQSLHRFWREYDEISATLLKLQALPAGAEIVPIATGLRSAKTKGRS